MTGGKEMASKFLMQNSISTDTDPLRGSDFPQGGWNTDQESDNADEVHSGEPRDYLPATRRQTRFISCMKSAKITGFLSCSFAEAEKPLNEFFNAVCKGLDVQCSNVSDGYKESPPAKAREMIEEAQLFIAIVTRREKVGDEFHMPPAVHDEISMAYAMDKPMLLFKEDGVTFKGFLSNYGTHVTFSRNALQNPEFLRKVIASIRNGPRISDSNLS